MSSQPKVHLNLLKPVESLSAEWILLQFLKDWRAEDIDLAVKNGVDLRKLIVENPDEAQKIGGLAQLFNPEWTVVDILYWFAVRRPDLYERLAREDGIEWIKSQWSHREGIKQDLTK